MFTENTKIYIKKNRVCDFIENHQQFGFSQDADGDFVLKKNLSNTQENLYVQVSFFSCTEGNFCRISCSVFYVAGSWNRDF